MITSKKYYSGVIIFEKKNIKHSYSSGSIAIHGSVSTRAYNHRIRGKHHCLKVFSLINNKPLLVISHQTSCVSCSLKLTEMMREKKPN